MRDLVKTWRFFLFGMCGSLLSLYLKKILVFFQMTKGVFLTNGIVVFSVIWFIGGIFRLHHLNQLYPELKNAFYKDKLCLVECGVIFILAMGLKILSN